MLTQILDLQEEIGNNCNIMIRTTSFGLEVRAEWPNTLRYQYCFTAWQVKGLNADWAGLFAATAKKAYKQGSKDQKFSDLLRVLRIVTDYASRQHCCHEDTHRGGVLWEICDQCGMKWADDEGGKPDDAGKLPEEIDRAYDILAKYKEVKA